MGYTVNGHTYEWADIRTSVDGQSIEFTSIDYSHGVDPQKAGGAGRKTRGSTGGQYNAEDAELEMLLSDWEAWRNALGNGYMRKKFTMTVSFADGDGDITTDTLKGCQIKKPKKTMKRGSDAIVVSVTLHVEEILENGLDPVHS